jgi:hypothetical protein
VAHTAENYRAVTSGRTTGEGASDRAASLDRLRRDQGIGAAITEALNAEGAHVAAGFSLNQEAAKRFAAGLADQGRSVSIDQANAGDPSDRRALARRARRGSR